MSDQSNATPLPVKSEQAARARRLRETIAATKRGMPGPKTPRSFTDEAAAEAARKGNRSGNR